MSSWLATTTWLTIATGQELRLSTWKLMEDLLVTLVVPVLVGQLAQLWSPLARVASQRKIFLGVLAQILVLSIVLKAASNVGLQIRERPFTWMTMATSAGLVVLAARPGLTGGFGSSRWLGFDRGPDRGAISCSQKTLPVSLFFSWAISRRTTRWRSCRCCFTMSGSSSLTRSSQTGCCEPRRLPRSVQAW